MSLDVGKGAHVRLGHSRFLGDYRAQRWIGDCALAELTPTVPEHEVEAHTHDDAHFLLLLGGTYLSSASGMPAECSVPTLILNPPGTAHRDRFRGCEGRFLTLSIPAGAWSVAAGHRELPRTSLKLSAPGMVQAMRLRWELSNWHDASPLVVEDGIEALLDECAIDEMSRMKHVPAWLERARQRLHDDWATTPSLAALAKEVDVHPVYFSRAFRQRYACSPGEYLRRCRLGHSLQLLRDPRLGLAEIALQCGYVDQAHFSNSFRRLFGTTPMQFRRLN